MISHDRIRLVRHDFVANTAVTQTRSIDAAPLRQYTELLKSAAVVVADCEGEVLDSVSRPEIACGTRGGTFFKRAAGAFFNFHTTPVRSNDDH